MCKGFYAYPLPNRRLIADLKGRHKRQKQITPTPKTVSIGEAKAKIPD